MKKYLVFGLVFVVVLSGCMLLFIYFYPLMGELLNIHIGLFGSSCVGTGCYYSRGGFHTTFPSGAGWYCRGYNIGPICTKDLYLYCRYTKPFEPAESAYVTHYHTNTLDIAREIKNAMGNISCMA